MAPQGVHRELLVPSPTGGDDRGPRRGPFLLSHGIVGWLEVHRVATGDIRLLLGAPTTSALGEVFEALRAAVPDVALGPERTCPTYRLFARRPAAVYALPAVRHHYWPIQRTGRVDHAALLLGSLTQPALGDGELVAQILFRPTVRWEAGFFSPRSDVVFDQSDLRTQERLQQRLAEVAIHVEMRFVANQGLDPARLAEMLNPWVHSWLSTRGGYWWALAEPKPRHQLRFRQALLGHDIQRFAARKVRRDISSSELSHLLPIPWRERYSRLHYAGPRSSGLPVALSASASGSQGFALGKSDGQPAFLPQGFHHLAILGRTRTGKSTLALNLVLELLRKHPEARVIVLEPTGALIEALRSREGIKVSTDPA